jgi:hypothetical protein
LVGTWKRRDTDSMGNVTFSVEGTVRATPLRVTVL